MEKKSISLFLAGTLLGVFLVTGLAFSQGGTIELVPHTPRLVVEGEEAVFSDRSGYYFNGNEYVPAAFIYRGTTYIPLRYLAEKLGHQVSWDSASKTVFIGEVPLELEEEIEEIAFETLALTEAPEEIQQWAEPHRLEEGVFTYHLNDRTYILITRGEKPTGGYGLEVNALLETSSHLYLDIDYIDPGPEDLVTQALTYPYALVVTERTEKPLKISAGTSISIDEG